MWRSASVCWLFSFRNGVCGERFETNRDNLGDDWVCWNAREWPAGQARMRDFRVCGEWNKWVSRRTRKGERKKNEVNKEFQLKIAVICLILIIRLTHSLLFCRFLLFYRPTFRTDLQSRRVVLISNFMQNTVHLLDLCSSAARAEVALVKILFLLKNLKFHQNSKLFVYWLHCSL